MWQKPSGLYFFKLGIPEALRRFFPSETPGKFKTHIVESLETYSRADALRLKGPRLVKYQAEFKRLAGGAVMPAPKPGQVLVSQVRAALVELEHDWRRGAIDGEQYVDLSLVLTDQAENAVERVQREQGEKAAELALQKLREPELPTIREALADYLATSDVSEQYRDAYRLAVSDLMAFVSSEDGPARDITDRLAVGFVDRLNSGPLSK
ncbi:MAG: hypothetical protein KGL43_10260, partial [Burkholderiales bacterium]|nr:hypothetical protein [Burkholderiales bacterium]